jgi:hypothetical protein
MIRIVRSAKLNGRRKRLIFGERLHGASEPDDLIDVRLTTAPDAIAPILVHAAQMKIAKAVGMQV